MATKIKPLGDRVLVQRAKAPTSKGGILLPETAKEKPREGIVISVGPGKVNENGQIEPMPIKAGDRVLFGPYAGTEIQENEEGYLILSEADIFGILS
jgi:chaperonin GroES